MSESLRASVYIRGATIQYVYGTNAQALARRATKLLTVFKPGLGNLYPQYFTIDRKISTVRGNLGTWEEISRTTIDQIPEESHDWRKREAARKVLKP